MLSPRVGGNLEALPGHLLPALRDCSTHASLLASSEPRVLGLGGERRKVPPLLSPVVPGARAKLRFSPGVGIVTRDRGVQSVPSLPASHGWGLRPLRRQHASPTSPGFKERAGAEEAGPGGAGLAGGVARRCGAHRGAVTASRVDLWGPGAASGYFCGSDSVNSAGSRLLINHSQPSHGPCFCSQCAPRPGGRPLSPVPDLCFILREKPVPESLALEPRKEMHPVGNWGCSGYSRGLP